MFSPSTPPFVVAVSAYPFLHSSFGIWRLKIQPTNGDMPAFLKDLFGFQGQVLRPDLC